MKLQRIVFWAGMGAFLVTTASAADTAADRKERAVSGPTIFTVAKQRTAAPGELVEVDVFIRNVTDLNVYQVVVEALNGESGSLDLEELEIQTNRSDYVFGEAQVVKAVHLEGARMGAIQVGSSVDVGRRAYLGTYRFRASEDSSGVFNVGVRQDRESFLRNSEGTAIEFLPGKAATISIGEVTTDRVGAERK